jgi:hypothetical protein
MDGAVNASQGPRDPGLQESINPGTHPVGDLNGVPFGNFDYSVPATAGQPASAGMFLHPGSLGVAWESTLPTTSAAASLNWNRAFALNPGASFTITGTFDYRSSLGYLPWGDYHSYGPGRRDPGEAPFNYLNLYRISAGDRYVDPSYAYLLRSYLSTADPRVAGSGNPDSTWVPGQGDFDYSLDSFGHLSMTVFNRSSELLFGSLSFGLWIESPVAIPEPAMWMTMLPGVAVLLALSRRRAWPLRSRQPAGSFA